MSDDKRGSHLQEQHNKGEQDAANGKYNPPHSISPLDVLFSTEKEIEHYVKDNEAYNKGRDNAKN